MNATHRANWAAALNLLVPGAGIIVLGGAWLGLGTGLLFLACANYALCAALLAPDDFSSTARALGIGVAAGMYLGAQVRFAQTVRGQVTQQRLAERRRILLAVRQCIEGNDFAGALDTLQPLRDSAERDLLVAFRLAQSHTGIKDAPAAEQAWQQVRRLDRRHIYRRELRAAQEVLKTLRDSAARSISHESNTL